MTTLENAQPALRDRSRTLTVWTGRLTAAIAVVHTVFFIPVTAESWSDWSSGKLWWDASNTADPELLWHYWVLPGGFVIPLLLLGLLISRIGKEGRAVPLYVGVTLGLWCAMAAALMFPSGFLLGFVPAGMLLMAARR